MDTRIKNTTNELANYDQALNELLDQVFDEYGLVVAGWSALWDSALRAAIERCPSHRFTTFWATRGELENEAAALVERRRAVLISIEDADSFFDSLKEKVISLEEINRPHPLSRAIAVSTLKRYLSEDRYRIRAHDLVLEQTKELVKECDVDRFPLNASKATFDDVIQRMKKYEALTEILLSLLITTGYWGEPQHEKILTDAVALVADGKQGGTGIKEYVNLQSYPALLLIYGAGIAAVAAGKYGNLTALLLRATGTQPNLLREEPLAYLLNADEVLRDIVKRIGSTTRTPVSDYLALKLREPLKEILSRDALLHQCFDRFEYLWCLLHIDLHTYLKTSSRWVIGRFLWSDEKHYDYKETELERLYSEIDREGDNWAGLKAGLFAGSLQRLQDTRRKFDEARPNLRQAIGMW